MATFVLELIISAIRFPNHKSKSAVKSKASLHRGCIIAPPFWHRNLLACSKKEEDEQHVEVKSSIKRSSNQVIIPLPDLKMATVSPIHYNISTNNGRCVTSTNVTVEHRQSSKKDTDVPQVNPKPGEKPVETEENRRNYRPYKEWPG